MYARRILSQYIIHPENVCRTLKIERQSILCKRYPLMRPLVRSVMKRSNPSQNPCPKTSSPPGTNKYTGPTMNDLPRPIGSWKEAHNEVQDYYNKVLVGGIVSLLGTILMIYIFGNRIIYWNYAYPPIPRTVD